MLDVIGDRDGDLVVLLPAFGVPRSMWREQQESLSALGYQVASLDLPGLSEADEPDFSMALASTSIAGALELHGQRPAHLVGISVGATLAAQVALDHPARVASLLLSGGQAHPGSTGRIEWLVARVLPERLVVGGVPGQVKKSYPAVAAESVAMQKRVGKRRLVAALHAFSQVDLRSRLGNIDAPTLVVCGTRNRLALKGSRDLAAGIPSARLELIKDVGHVWNLEEPELFTATVDNFIRRGR